MDNEKFFTVGELAHRCGVTVRTLQFYDKDGLLSPSHYTEGGRRLYKRREWSMVQEYTGGDEELIKTLMSIGADVENWPQEVDELKIAVFNSV